jgi:hypothetical protein
LGEADDAFPSVVLEQGLPPDGQTQRRCAIAMRMRHFGPRTQATYLDWVLSWTAWHWMMGDDATVTLEGQHLAPFLDHLAGERRMSANTQQQILCAWSSFLKLGIKARPK